MMMLAVSLPALFGIKVAELATDRGTGYRFPVPWGELGAQQTRSSNGSRGHRVVRLSPFANRCICRCSRSTSQPGNNFRREPWGDSISPAWRQSEATGCAAAPTARERGSRTTKRVVTRPDLTDCAMCESRLVVANAGLRELLGGGTYPLAELESESISSRECIEKPPLLAMARAIIAPTGIRTSIKNPGKNPTF